MLSLRHVFQMLHGNTSGPNTFSGSIGKQLSRFVSEWGIAQFKKTPNPTFSTLAPCTAKELDSDQYYAYKICTAIIQGNAENDLKLVEIGSLCHSCWLTLACRILR